MRTKTVHIKTIGSQEQGISLQEEKILKNISKKDFTNPPKKTCKLHPCPNNLINED